MSSRVSAQGYGTAAGVRLESTGIGLTIQQQVALHSTVELMFTSGFSNKMTNVTALYEKHVSLITRGLNFYVGIGPHMNFVDKEKYPTLSNSGGIAAIAGMELNIGSLSMSADFKPQLNIGGNGDLFDSHVGISFRYIIFDRFIRDDSWKFWEGWFRKKKK